jgi:DNA-binding LacI/PurR family transcriptional regulator
MAFATIEVARHEFHLEVGRQISIVGFDDVALAEWPSFSLTTYSQPIVTMVDRAISTLKALLSATSDPVRAVIPGELVVRTSARVPQHGLEIMDQRCVWRN